MLATKQDKIRDCLFYIWLKFNSPSIKFCSQSNCDSCLSVNNVLIWPLTALSCASGACIQLFLLLLGTGLSFTRFLNLVTKKTRKKKKKTGPTRSRFKRLYYYTVGHIQQPQPWRLTVIVTSEVQNCKCHTLEQKILPYSAREQKIHENML